MNTAVPTLENMEESLKNFIAPLFQKNEVLEKASVDVCKNV